MSPHPAPHTARRVLLGLAALAILFAAPSFAHAYGYEPRTTIINTAILQAGKPYVYGEDGPNAFDCSGLTQYCYASAGISIPHQSGAIWSMCDTVTADKLEPGDLVFRARLPAGVTEPRTAGDIYHVGMYVGGSRVFEASTKSKPIGYNSLSSFKHYGRLKEKYWKDLDRNYDQSMLARGDFTGDGREDLAYVYKTGTTSIRINVHASNGTTLGPAQAWYVSSGAWEWDRTKVASGDFNGDGKADLALMYGYGNGTVKIWVFRSDGKTFARQAWWASAPTGWTWSRMKLTAADFTGDRKADIAALYDHGGGAARLWVFRSSGIGFTPVSWWYSGPNAWWAKWTKVAAGDITGDGKADLAMFYNVGRDVGKTYVFTSSGTRFANGGSWYAPTPALDWNRAKVVCADLAGDKKADVVLLYDMRDSSSKLIALPSSGTAIGPAKDWWTSVAGGWNWERARLGAGDTNKDGRTDITMMYDEQSSTARAWILRSASGGGLGPISIGWYSGGGGLDWNRVR